MTMYVHNLLPTVDFNQVDLKYWIIIDSGATSNFLVTEAPVVDIVPALNPLTMTILIMVPGCNPRTIAN